ncbi:hypothetical protein BJ741DRAFT_338264 [Chytriomyces cf. hyalinus JEL632]|nr:hypothetical protein BJ741DRAFT_338264 [Chytriomyces cf. hyalinus JEL632]
MQASHTPKRLFSAKPVLKASKEVLLRRPRMLFRINLLLFASVSPLVMNVTSWVRIDESDVARYASEWAARAAKHAKREVSEVSFAVNGIKAEIIFPEMAGVTAGKLAELKSTMLVFRVRENELDATVCQHYKGKRQKQIRTSKCLQNNICNFQQVISVGRFRRKRFEQAGSIRSNGFIRRFHIV